MPRQRLSGHPQVVAAVSCTTVTTVRHPRSPSRLCPQVLWLKATLRRVRPTTQTAGPSVK